MKHIFITILLCCFTLLTCSRNMMGPSSGPALYIDHTVKLDHPLQKIFFIDEQHGWALTDSSGIYRTIDGGSNWEYSSFGKKTWFQDMSFVNSSTGWVCGFDTTVLHTTDGGRTWTQQFKEHADDSIIYHIEFANSTEGWLFTAQGGLFGTSDGGDSWQLKTHLEPRGINFFRMWGSSGITVRYNGDMLKTEDGWESWTTAQMPSQPIGQTFFINPNDGWLMQTFPPYS